MVKIVLRGPAPPDTAPAAARARFARLRSILRVAAGSAASDAADAVILTAAPPHPDPATGVYRIVRVDPLAGGVDPQLDSLVGIRPDAVLLSGCRGGADVQHLGAKLAVHEALLGLATGAIAIVAESAAAALLDGQTFVDASPRLVGLVWDADALAAALGCTAQGRAAGYVPPLDTARSLLVLAAAAAGVAAVDTASAETGARFAAACHRARAMGFSGKVARGPAQVASINAAFAKA